MFGQPAFGAPLDLGLGQMLNAQVRDQVSDEERKKRLGLIASPGVAGLSSNFGRTGIASRDLGMGSRSNSTPYGHVNFL